MLCNCRLWLDMTQPYAKFPVMGVRRRHSVVVGKWHITLWSFASRSHPCALLVVVGGDYHYDVAFGKKNSRLTGPLAWTLSRCARWEIQFVVVFAKTDALPERQQQKAAPTMCQILSHWIVHVGKCCFYLERVMLPHRCSLQHLCLIRCISNAHHWLHRSLTNLHRPWFYCPKQIDDEHLLFRCIRCGPARKLHWSRKEE